MGISIEIKRFMLDALARGEVVTIAQVMDHFKCSRRTAQYCRARLLRDGAIPAGVIRKGGRPRRPIAETRLPDSDWSAQLPPPEVPNIDQKSASAMIQRVLSGESVPLTTEQQRAILSELILHSPNHAIKVAAQNSLTKLDAQSGGGVSYAPPIPMTNDAKAKRLALLMQACGLSISKFAFGIAFPRSTELESENARSEAS